MRSQWGSLNCKCLRHGQHDTLKYIWRAELCLPKFFQRKATRVQPLVRIHISWPSYRQNSLPRDGTLQGDSKPLKKIHEDRHFTMKFQHGCDFFRLRANRKSGPYIDIEESGGRKCRIVKSRTSLTRIILPFCTVKCIILWLDLNDHLEHST